MGESKISSFELVKSEDEYSSEDKIEINVQFSLQGDLRDAFNEVNWTKAYDANDVSFKLKYGVKLTSGGFRKKELGRTIDTYRKASIFWTRNPKLVNPMKDRRIWIQVAKNFEPFIRLSEEEVREELFDFNEKFVFNASDLGKGKHKLSAEAFASWQKHEFTEPGSVKNSSDEIEITINQGYKELFRVIIMAKYDGLLGQPVLEVEDPDKEGGITFIFKDNRFMFIKAADGKIETVSIPEQVTDEMEKYDPIKMLELVKVEDPDSEGGLTLIFQENKTLKIKIVDGKLVSEFV